ncbi:MAG: CoA ester lyase [Hyphomicrobiaceae bacterium]|nr:CoA ester lyase [Hyphomicrobiaceae bacterium]
MSDAIRPRRSVLYMPGSNARALEKARTLDTDAVILDLEDAVAPDAKDLARTQVCDAVKAGGFGPREVVIRINSLASPYGLADLEAAAMAAPDAILVPKVSSAEDLADVETRLAALGADPKIAIWAMIETPRAILDIRAIADAGRSVAPRLACFIMGTNDLAKETGARLVPGRAPMLAFLSLSVAAARMAGIAVVDGVYNSLDNAEGFAAECLEGRDLGMDGKTLIHPRQLDDANRIFAPDPAEVDAAQAIIDAFALPENASLGAISLNGRMVERLHAEIAEKVVALANAIKARG